MVPSDNSDLLLKVASVATRAWELNQALEAVIAHKPRGVRPEVTTRALEAPLPWNNQVAYLVLELHRTARVIELKLLHLHDFPGDEHQRGSSSANTERALNHVTVLLHGLTSDVVVGVLNELFEWSQRAEVVLGLVEPVTPLPTPQGAAPTRCPWCSYLTLRVRTQTRVAWCVNPNCRYGPDDQRRPQGKVYVDHVTGLTHVDWTGSLPETEVETA